MQQATTNMRSHSRIAKPEGSAPRAPTHRVGRAPLCFTPKSKHAVPRNRGTCSTTGHTLPKRTKQYRRKHRENQREEVKRTTAIQPGGWRRPKKCAHPPDRPQPSKTKRFHNNAICYVKKQASTYSDENIPAYIQPQEQEQPHNNVAKTRKMKATARLATRCNSWIFHDASFTKSWYLQGFVKT